MSDFFYQIVTDAINWNDADAKEELFALKPIGMREWCEEQIDYCGYRESTSKHFINCALNDLFAGDSEFPYKLWRYIQDTCMPDDDEEDDTIVTGVECKKCTNVLPPHTIAEHMTKTHPIHTCPHQVTK